MGKKLKNKIIYDNEPLEFYMLDIESGNKTILSETKVERETRWPCCISDSRWSGKLSFVILWSNKRLNEFMFNGMMGLFRNLQFVIYIHQLLGAIQILNDKGEGEKVSRGIGLD